GAYSSPSLGRLLEVNQPARRRMSAQEQPSQARTPVARKVAAGAAVLSVLVLSVWYWIVEQSHLAKEKMTGFAIIDAETIRLYLWIAIGSALGGVARYWCSGVAARMFGATFPWGTLIVNVDGQLIMWCFALLTGPDGR